LEGAPPPAEFTARIRNEYGLESLSRVIVKGDDVEAGRSAVHRPPSNEYSYVVIADPPLKAGPAKEIVAVVDARTAPLIVGASGTRRGVVVHDEDAVPAPLMLTALINTLTNTPLVRPEIRSELRLPIAADDHEPPPLTEYSYPVIGEPPLFDGVLYVTVALESPGAMERIDGAEGGSGRGVPITGAESAPRPRALIAAIRTE